MFQWREQLFEPIRASRENPETLPEEQAEMVAGFWATRQQLVERHQSAGGQEDIHYNVVEVFTSFMKHGAQTFTNKACSVYKQGMLSLQRRHAQSKMASTSTGCTKEMRAAGLEGQS